MKHGPSYHGAISVVGLHRNRGNLSHNPATHTATRSNRHAATVIGKSAVATCVHGGHGGPLKRVRRASPLQDVSSVQGGDGEEDDVFLHVVPTALEERRQLLLALLETALCPFHRGVVHLIDGDDKHAHTQSLRQERMFSRLPALLETCLELALAR